MFRGREKKIALFLGLTALFALLLSSFLITLENHHHCHGEDCPICACIQQCRDNLRQLGDTLLPSVVCFVLFTAVLSAAFSDTAPVLQDSLVSRKVRMDN
ncbi:MAG: hypothetical protein IK115_01905 [Lachnospiraceae bacterium]|nr:hypothetical protein [Lachnospiraceae bacterium]